MNVLAQFRQRGFLAIAFCTEVCNPTFVRSYGGLNSLLHSSSPFN
jgi:hypothetical protein